MGRNAQRTFEKTLKVRMGALRQRPRRAKEQAQGRMGAAQGGERSPKEFFKKAKGPGGSLKAKAPGVLKPGGQRLKAGWGQLKVGREAQRNFKKRLKVRMGALRQRHWGAKEQAQGRIGAAQGRKGRPKDF